MNVEEIQERVDALAKAMLAKGMREPCAQFTIRDNATSDIHLRWKSGIDRGGVLGDEKWEFFNGDLPDVLDKADEFVASQPGADEAKLNDFMAALGSVIDIGKKHNIDVDFLNPLVKTMERLSENVITDQRSA